MIVGDFNFQLLAHALLAELLLSPRWSGGWFYCRFRMPREYWGGLMSRSPASSPCRHHLFVCSSTARLSSPNDLGFSLASGAPPPLSSCFSFAPVLPLCCYLTSPILRTLRQPHNYALRVPWLEKRIPQLTFTLLADGKQHPSGLPLDALPVPSVFRPFSVILHNCSLRKHI